jgi:NhaA family Na+:H+ antiporter
MQIRTPKVLLVPTKLFIDFFNSEKAGGLLLVFCTLFSLALANSFYSVHYIHFWHLPIAGQPAEYWINDGLMAIFFLLIGLELEREIYAGELSNLKTASLPIIAAIGGMLVPAAIFLLFNYGLPTQSGAGIPMATDIAFAIGILSLLGNRVPLTLKILLTAIAVIDDLGAIIIIAIFYTSTIDYTNLFIALGIFGLLLVMNRMKIRNLVPYLLGGVVMWYFMLHSGVHATITGVLLAFAIPFGDGKEKSASYILQHVLHKPVAFIIIPLFTLANTCIPIAANWMDGVGQANSLGIIMGLVIGKPAGVVLFSFIAVATGWSSLPDGINWKQLLCLGVFCGIGFTMSIFITLLAYDNPEIVSQSKIDIFIASLIASVTGFLLLRFVGEKNSLV